MGYGPSPVLYKDKVIVLADQDDGDKSFIAALRASDGRIAWRHRAAESWVPAEHR